MWGFPRFVLPYIRTLLFFLFFLFFSLMFHVGTGIIEYYLHFTSTIYKRVQCYWLRIGNKPSSPRDCTWHCNTSWTGEDEPFPIGRLTRVETLLFYFSLSHFPRKITPPKKWKREVAPGCRRDIIDVILGAEYGVHFVLYSIVRKGCKSDFVLRTRWLLHHSQQQS